MATQKPLVMVGGVLQEIPSGDTVPPAALPLATGSQPGAISAAQFQSLIIVSATEPSSPYEGMLWLDIS